MTDSLGLADRIYWKATPLAQPERLSVRELLERIARGDVDDGALVAVSPGAWQPITEVQPLADAVGTPIVRRRVREVEESNIDLAPMIDVTFLLLLFFMFTATYEKQKTLDTPPTPSEGAIARPTLEELREDHLIARISADGSLDLDGQPVAWENLKNALERSIREKNTARLIIVADDNADWGLVVRVQDEANLAGIEKILFGKGVRAGGA